MLKTLCLVLLFPFFLPFFLPFVDCTEFEEEEEDTFGEMMTNYIDELNLPAVEEWPHRPLFVRDHHSPSSISAAPLQSCQIGTAFHFESKYFIGQALIRIRDLPQSSSEDKQFFKGRKRRSYVVIQGRFKQRLNCANVVIGSEFEQPLKYAPPARLNGMIRSVLRRMSPGVICELDVSRPRVLTTLSESCQTIHVTQSTSAIDNIDTETTIPDILDSNSITEYGMLPGTNTNSRSNPKSSSKLSKERKQYFTNPAHAQAQYYETDKVYTFEMYDDLISYHDYQLHLMPFMSFDMVKVLGRQPFQFMVKVLEDDDHKEGYVWRFDLIHEQFLNKNN